MGPTLRDRFGRRLQPALLLLIAPGDETLKAPRRRDHTIVDLGDHGFEVRQRHGEILFVRLLVVAFAVLWLWALGDVGGGGAVGLLQVAVVLGVPVLVVWLGVKLTTPRWVRVTPEELEVKVGYLGSWRTWPLDHVLEVSYENWAPGGTVPDRSRGFGPAPDGEWWVGVRLEDGTTVGIYWSPLREPAADVFSRLNGCLDAAGIEDVHLRRKSTGAVLSRTQQLTSAAAGTGEEDQELPTTPPATQGRYWPPEPPRGWPEHPSFHVWVYGDRLCVSTAKDPEPLWEEEKASIHTAAWALAMGLGLLGVFWWTVADRHPVVGAAMAVLAVMIVVGMVGRFRRSRENLARGPYVHVFMPDELGIVNVVAEEDEDMPIQGYVVDTREIEDVSVGQGTVLLERGGGVFELKFHALRTEEELAWAQRAVEYGLASYSGWRPDGMWSKRPDSHASPTRGRWRGEP